MKYLAIVLLALLSLPFAHAQTFNEKAFKKKAKKIIDITADEYNPPKKTIGDPEKYYWPKAMARFEKYGLQDSAANSWINDFANHPPFHFTLVGMARIYKQYDKAPALVKNKLMLLKQVMGRDDSYNAWTSEGTENHNSMARTSGYLYSQYALKDYPEMFPEAAARKKEAEAWLRWWANNLFTMGNGEWNTNIYEVYNMIGWLNIYDFAEDEDMRLLARAVLDFYSAEVALHYSWGLMGGAEMRGAGVGHSYNSSTRYMTWLWFAEKDAVVPPFKTSEYIQSMHVVTSSYRPSNAAVQIALKKDVKGNEVYLNSRPSYVQDRPSYVKQVFSVNPTFTLGSASVPYGGFTGTTYQMVNWKLIGKPKKKEEPYEISGNGRFYKEYSGKTRDPFTQYLQYKNTFFQLTRHPENVDEILATVDSLVADWQVKWTRDFKQRFPTDRDRSNHINRGGGQSPVAHESFITLPEKANLYEAGGKWFVGLGETFVALTPVNVKASIKKEEKTGRQILSVTDERGKLIGWVLEAAGTNEFKSLKAFEQAVLSKAKASFTNETVTYTNLAGDKITATFQPDGENTDALVDWGFGPTTQVANATQPPFKQPNWPKGENAGRVGKIEVNGKMPYDLTKQWPVFNGPRISMDAKELMLIGKDKKGATDKVVIVSFTEENPRFKIK